MYSAVRLWTSVQAVIGSCLASGGAGGEDAGGGDEVGDAFNLVAPEADGGVVEAQYSSFFTQDYVRGAGRGETSMIWARCWLQGRANVD